MFCGHIVYGRFVPDSLFFTMFSNIFLYLYELLTKILIYILKFFDTIWALKVKNEKYIVLFVRKLNNLNLEHRPWYIVYILIYFFKVTRRAIEQINPEKTLPLHVSLDIDVLDPNEAPATGTRGTFYI